MLNGFWPVVGILFIVFFVVSMLRDLPSFRERQPTTFPYQKVSVLFSPAERSFLAVLEQALGSQYRVMGKVRLADVIQVRQGVNGSGWRGGVNSIQSEHVDFVVCSPKDSAVRCVVELDDQSHTRAKRQDRDEFVDKALQAAGVPVLHFTAKRSYSVPDIRKALLEKVPTSGDRQITL